MGLTLLEASKSFENELQRAVVEIYAENSPILRVLPFSTIAGSALRYNQEDTLPGIGFRGVNESYTESTGVINPVVEPLVIAGGDVDVDNFILGTMGMDQRSTQESMKIKALAHKWSHNFVKGDSITNPREFDGLQARITGNQLIANGNSAGGDVLSLDKFDELIDAVDDPTHLIMSKKMRRRLTTASRTEAVGGNITHTRDEFGNKIDMYAELPIIIADPNSSAFSTLGFNEANPGGGTSESTSIYCLSLREGMLEGIQSSDPDVRDLGELQDKPSMRTRVEWFNGVSVWHPRAAARLWGIKDGAVAA